MADCAFAYDAPILKIFVPHTGQMPCVAGRPFFIVIAFASLISREALHFTQYPVATGHLHARILTRCRIRNGVVRDPV